MLCQMAFIFHCYIYEYNAITYFAVDRETFGFFNFVLPWIKLQWVFLRMSFDRQMYLHLFGIQEMELMEYKV